MTTSEKTYSRSDLVDVANISTTQIDYLMKLGVVTPDLGDKRKRFSQEETILVVVAGAVLRFGLSAVNLKQPFAWLREQVHDKSRNGFFHNVQMTCGEGFKDGDLEIGPKPLYVMIFATDEGEWSCKWSTGLDALEGLSAWQTLDLRHIFQSLNFKVC